MGGLDMVGAMESQTRRAENFATQRAAFTVNGTKRGATIGAQGDTLFAAKQAVFVVYTAHLHNAAIEIVAHRRAVLYHRESPQASSEQSGEEEEQSEPHTQVAAGCKAGRGPIS
jgi:hypothetical protein